MTVLADTSVWVEYLRQGTKGPARALDGLLERGEVVLCGPVVAELIAGTPSDRRAELWNLLAGLPWIDLNPPQWRRAGEAAGELRQQGRSVPLTDIEVAVAAVDGGAQLWTRDADFQQIAGVLKGLNRFEPSR